MLDIIIGVCRIMVKVTVTKYRKVGPKLKFESKRNFAYSKLAWGPCYILHSRNVGSRSLFPKTRKMLSAP